ncbi:DUF1403 family protein [Aliihoeflea sp. 40Bstr573]|uniref:DUF1403 family protein n=1 Tax=Aliihoeflea sp. 40Bstr573 TaxID=2696467 RepID=UPI002094A551|nr:DUF1403 family protein [Aliihoeflea sp. 40Bstr573]MCO6389095.1 DUF1403 family protein [Aliihoeflea sp. 40Bstr573]
MILRHKSSPRHTSALTGAAAAAPVSTVPTWMRRAVPDPQSLAGKDIEDMALVAGAAIGALDAVVRRQERWSGAWRQRLALVAAAVTAKQAGRVEDERALRDTFVFSGPGDCLSESTTLGPAGLFLLAWRRLATWPAVELLTKKNLAAVLEEFGYAPDDAVVSDLADDLQQLSASPGTVGILTGAFMTAERHGFGRAVGAWLADALLAQRLGWSHALPLLGIELALGTSARPRRSTGSSVATNVEIGSESVKSLLAAQARTALRAIDLSTELGRRAEKLLAIAPKLRARGADAVVERLLSGDAMVASDNVGGMSDRGLRRLFDRLVDLGAVRELTGRTAFRIYGL